MISFSRTDGGYSAHPFLPTGLKDDYIRDPGKAAIKQQKDI